MDINGGLIPCNLNRVGHLFLIKERENINGQGIQLGLERDIHHTFVPKIGLRMDVAVQLFKFTDQNVILTPKEIITHHRGMIQIEV